MTRNPLKIDPTRTGMIRRAFEAEIFKRFRRLKGEILHLVDKSDAFDLRKKSTKIFNAKFGFESDTRKIDEFGKWFQQKIDTGVMGGSAGNSWSDKYIADGYEKGAGRAFTDVRKPALASKNGSVSDFFNGSRNEFLRSSFGAPETIEKLNGLISRTFMDLKGATNVMADQVRRELADGLVRGQGPRDIARRMTNRVDKIGRTRATIIARTEIIRAHSEGQLDAMDKLGVEEVGVMVEWSTAGDDRVCQLCLPLEAVVMKIAEARGIIPRHPQCRCTWIPANVGESKKGRKVDLEEKPVAQKRTQAQIAKARNDSLRSEFPKIPLKSARRATRWIGGDSKFAKIRPRSVLDAPQTTAQRFPPANSKAETSLKKYQNADGTFTPERQALHDDIVNGILDKGTKVETPVTHMTGGGPASGKSVLFKEGKVKLPKRITTVDSDEIKKLIPDYTDMVAAKDSTAAAYAHEESSMLAKRVLNEGRDRGQSVFLDGTGDSSIDALIGKVKKMKKDGRRVVANYVTVDTEIAVERNVARAAKTGRNVPNDFVRKTHESISDILPKALDEKLFDDVTLWDTNTDGKVFKVMTQVDGKTIIHDEKLWQRFLDKSPKNTTPVKAPVKALKKRPAKITPSSTVEEAEEKARKFIQDQPREHGAMRFNKSKPEDIGRVDFSHLDLDRANLASEMLEELAEEADRLGIPRLRGFNEPTTAGNSANMGDGILGMGRLLSDEIALTENINNIVVKGPHLRRVVADDRVARLAKMISEEKDPFIVYDLKVQKKWWSDEAKRAKKFTGDSRKYEDTVFADWKWGDERALRPYSSQDYVTSGRDKMKNTYYHEFGHHIELNQSAEWQIELGELYEDLRMKSLGDVPGKDIARSASRYGDTNEHEWFAENYAFHRQGRLDLVHPEAAKMIEKIAVQ